MREGEELGTDLDREWLLELHQLLLALPSELLSALHALHLPRRQFAHDTEHDYPELQQSHVC